jgi:hypothetical protein
MDRSFGLAPTLHRRDDHDPAATTVVDRPRPERVPDVAHEGRPPVLVEHGPERVTTGAALLRHPILAVLCLALVLGPALAFALARSPEYGAETRLLVGRVDVEAQAVPGFTEATQDLAALYARLVDTEAVVEPVAAELGLGADEVREAVAASPIPEAAMIRVEARAASDDTSRALVDAAAVALTEHVTSLGGADPLASPAYERLTAATNALGDAEVRQGAIQASIDLRRSLLLDAQLGEPNLPPVDQLEAELRQLNADLVAVTGEVRRLQGEVSAAQAGFNATSRDAAEAAGLEVLGAAASQGSDRATSVAAAGIAGLVGGILVAIGVVTLRANVGYLGAVRRAARAPQHGPRPA